MLGVTGKTVSATAAVFVPKGTAPSTGWPIVAWAHGTTGVADVCAPSLSADLGGVDPMIAALVQQGFMVVAPDYEGLGSEGIHPYLNLASEGRSLVYAVMAARENVPAASTRWMAYGHSQGGHAALGAAQYASEATGLSYLGTVAIAPASNLALALGNSQTLVNALLQSGQTAAAIGVITQQTAFSTYVTAGLKNTQSINYSDVLEPRAAALAPLAESTCTLGQSIAADVQQYAASTGSISSYPALKANFASVPAIQTFLNTQTEPATVKLNQPVLIIQGDKDTTVLPALTAKLVTDLSNKGTQVTYQVLNGQDHIGVFTSSISTAIGFIQTRFAATS